MTATRPQARPVASDRAEDEACEKGTPGCAISHRDEAHDGSCETW